MKLNLYQVNIKQILQFSYSEIRASLRKLPHIFFFYLPIRISQELVFEDGIVVGEHVVPFLLKLTQHLPDETELPRWHSELPRWHSVLPRWHRTSQMTLSRGGSGFGTTKWEGGTEPRGQLWVESLPKGRHQIVDKWMAKML